MSSIRNLLHSRPWRLEYVHCLYQCISLQYLLLFAIYLSLTLREERRLKIFENRVLRRTFGPKWNEVTGSAENYIMSLIICTPHTHCSGDKIENEMGGACSAYGERRVIYRILVGKPEGKRPLGRPRRIWEDNTKMHIQEVGCGGLDWIKLAQDRDRWRTLVNAVMNLRVP